MTLDDLAERLHQMSPEERNPIRDSYELAKNFADYFYQEQGLILLVGDSGVIRENTTPINNKKGLPHDYLVTELGYQGLNIYDGRMGSFLEEVDKEHPREKRINDLAIAIDIKTGDVIGAKLFIEGTDSRTLKVFPGGNARHISAAYASKLDTVYAILVSEDEGTLTTFRDDELVDEMCYDPKENHSWQDYAQDRLQPIGGVPLQTHYNGKRLSYNKAVELAIAWQA